MALRNAFVWLLLLGCFAQGVRAQMTYVEPSLPLATQGHCAASYNRFVPLLMATHVFGGYDGVAYLNHNRWFEVVGSNSTPWLVAAPMPTARAYAVAAQGPAKLLYVIGGENSSGKLSVVEIYNPVTDTWSTGTPMPQALSHAGAAYMGGKIYVAGGYTSAGALSSAVYTYDPVLNSWATVASLPAPRAALALATGFNGMAGAMRLFAIGGVTLPFGTTGTTLNTEYNAVTNTWTARAVMPTARCFHGAAGDYMGAAGSASMGRVHVFGGRNGASVLGNYEYYDVNANTWTAAALSPSPSPCYGHSMHVFMYGDGCVSDGVTLLGGNSGSGLLTQHYRITTWFALDQQNHNLVITPVSVSAVDISWELEDNHLAAEVWLEKSRDAISFSALSDRMEASQGNKQKYTYSDTQLWSGLQYYRPAIRQTDGQTTYSKAIAYESQQLGWQAQLSPVPTYEASTLWVEGLAPGALVRWAAIASDGAKVAVGSFMTDGSGTNAEPLPLQNWPAGCYWIQVFAGEESKTLKCLILR